MKKLVIIIVLIVLTGCSSTQFVDSWKNPETTSFNPKKALVVGITDNLTARKIFEEDFKDALILRNINAVESTTVLSEGFTSSKKSEEEINEMIQKISNDGFDAVVITVVKGVEKQKSYYENYPRVGFGWSRFGRYYYWYQDIYYTPRYYETYNVYHIETSIYNLNGAENKSLIWVGSFKVVDPQTISVTVKDYVDRIINQLETEQLIRKR
ncbi:MULTISPECIES: hypothetical protein [Flavobacteriaceae]|uniref:DUF4136 domain-containing protein n=2 Tax=Flavobacteriaceae TaxID=49546 RepID=A0A4Y8AVI4_9FLAO|nr:MULTISPECIES: hypothetical protein [Flavobacteriaceae]TEW75356.1 hypothetical protein E2488_07545 [Gramella jeungdoensis]GGK44544.1 hypothetical protein GCM10007963_10920 [Lutibacter litoralis]